MKRIFILSLALLGMPALAQEARYVPTSEVLFQKTQECEANWSSQLAQLRGVIGAQQKQIEALTKERDELKIKGEEARP